MIVGAGLAGLIAGYIAPGLDIVEASHMPQENHRALLRFRDKTVSDITGIPFRKVRVRKGIWHHQSWVQPNPSACNDYSKKVLGRIADRSIWDIRDVERYIAPDDFYDRMLIHHGERIHWSTPYDFRGAKNEPHPVISTAPMPLVLKQLNLEFGEEFKREKIRVRRYRIPDCDVFQTVYYPSPGHPLYRASISGDILILEFANNPDEWFSWKSDVERTLGINVADQRLEDLGEVEQRFGKIAEVNDDRRKAAIHMLTGHYNIYSLGRFATWRNILLDDVASDMETILRLIKGSRYEQRLASI